MNKMIRALLTTMFFSAALVQAAEFDLQDASLPERMTYHRAIDAAVWAMPLMNFKFWRDSLAENGVGPNDIGYNSKLQDWRFQTATPNNTTPYIHAYWNFENGPVVVEMPASDDGIGVFGTIMDAWQRPLEDVGAKGRDQGLGARYLLIPPGYDGKLLPGALVYEQETFNGWAILRPILPGGATEENLAKATALTKQIRIYPLAMADDPPESSYVGRLRKTSGDDAEDGRQHLSADTRHDSGGSSTGSGSGDDGSAGTHRYQKRRSVRAGCCTAGHVR